MKLRELELSGFRSSELEWHSCLSTMADVLVHFRAYPCCKVSGGTWGGVLGRLRSDEAWPRLERFYLDQDIDATEFITKRTSENPADGI